jgi:hypothetical protein
MVDFLKFNIKSKKKFFYFKPLNIKNIQKNKKYEFRQN